MSNTRCLLAGHRRCWRRLRCLLPSPPGPSAPTPSGRFATLPRRRVDAVSRVLSRRAAPPPPALVGDLLAEVRLPLAADILLPASVPGCCRDHCCWGAPREGVADAP